MSEAESSGEARPAMAWDFTTTHWSVVLAAGGNSDTRSAAALDALCRAYWYPLYFYVRRHGQTAQEAQDSIQEFFLRILQKNSLTAADPTRGRFRSFLLTSLKHFLMNEWEKARTAKRGGGQPGLSLDAQDAEGRYLAEPADTLSPDKIYEKRWAVALVENVLSQLRAEYVKDGKGALFDALKAQVWGEGTESYQELAARLQTSEGGLRVAAHRMREQFRRLLRQEVANTVSASEEIEEELRHLIGVLRG